VSAVSTASRGPTAGPAAAGAATNSHAATIVVTVLVRIALSLPAPRARRSRSRVCDMEHVAPEATVGGEAGTANQVNPRPRPLKTNDKALVNN
jgi:hypothetical protein